MVEKAASLVLLPCYNCASRPEARSMRQCNGQAKAAARPDLSNIKA